MIRSLAFAAAAALVFAASSLAQDAKSTPKGRQLPQNWAKLGLSEEQKDKIYEIQGEYRGKIEELTKQIQALQKKQREALEVVLTDAQKARLKEILLEKAPSDKPKSGDKPAATKPAEKPADKPGDK